jgi:hypothetical protein
VLLALGGRASAQAAGSSAIGSVQTISGTSISLKTDAGAVVNVSVQDGARVVRIEPGETSLKNAAPIQLTDIQAGDRVLARGMPGPDGRTVLANSVVAIKKAAVESKQQQELQDWQRRGVGGLVASVDKASGTVVLKVAAAAGARTVTVHTASGTKILRYAPDSVKFDDAKPSTLDAVTPGDQLLARGTRSADGGELTADAVISGAFRNLSGTITAVNAGEGVLTLSDIATKKPVTVKITADSQMHKLAPQMATMLGARIKAAGAPAGGNGNAPNAGASANSATADAAGRGAGRGFGGGRGGAGSGDLSQIIARSPVVTLAELQKGDEVMIVSTSGSGTGPVSAITLVAGVEPILEASPTSNMNLPAWNVSGGDAGGGSE